MLENKNSPHNLVSSKLNCFKIQWIQKIKIYKTQNRLFVVGSNVAETKFRIIKIDRTEPWDLVIFEDKVDYNSLEINDTIRRLHGGNVGNLKWKKELLNTYTAHGLVGFVRFLEGYYMIIVTKQSKVAEIGGHSIYKIEDTTMIYIPNGNVRLVHPDEQRYLKIFQTVDLSSNFYFSYSYDLTNSLQFNMVRLHQGDTSSGCQGGEKRRSFTEPTLYPYTQRNGKSMSPCARFVWNGYLTEPLSACNISSLWRLHIIHGHVTQSCINVYGKQIYITLIGRRSSDYAGTRFMKRGCNINGDVANEVETEQIVHCASTSSLHHTPFTSFVQHRGSVPVHWQQDITANVMPSKPAITVNSDNPYAQATAKHFRNMMERFGTPIIVLNLVRKREKRFRESILGHEFKCAVDYLNQFLKTDHQIQYYAIDMAQLSRAREPTVMAKLANIAEKSLFATGIFQSKPDLFQETLGQTSRWKDLGGKRLCGYRIQTGVLRTNCVDCLDRTNSAQFVAGKCALAYQLYSLGVLSEPEVHFETDAARLYEEMFEAHGDIVALQYGGSQLVHTIQSYRRTVAPWASHSRDIVTTISRYYTNTFSDADKQSAMNLFLGVFRPTQRGEHLWDISTDHYLHNRDAQVLASFSACNYTRWWSPTVCKSLPLPYDMVHDVQKSSESNNENPCHETVSSKPFQCKDCTDWYDDLHNPSQLTVFDECFSVNISNTFSRYMSVGSGDASPFVLRSESWEEVKQDQLIQASYASLQNSLDLSSNDSSNSDDGESPTKRDSFDADMIGYHRSAIPPWLRTPTLNDFSPKVMYGIDLDNCPTSKNISEYERYIECEELSDQSISGSSSYDDETVLPVLIPTVDLQSLRLYEESVNHTYQTDTKYYADYLARSHSS